MCLFRRMVTILREAKGSLCSLSCTPNQISYKAKFSSSCPFLSIAMCSKTQKVPEVTEDFKPYWQAPMRAHYKDSFLNYVQRWRTATVNDCDDTPWETCVSVVAFSLKKVFLSVYLLTRRMFYDLSVVYLHWQQNQHSYVWGPLLRKIRIPWTHTLPSPKNHSINKYSHWVMNRKVA